jgi:DNA-binding LacI/PurR family transcriptional regulator
VPDDLMLATMTDGPVAENARVPITAMRTDSHAAAARLVELVALRLSDASEPQSNAWLELEMVERMSTLRVTS